MLVEDENDWRYWMSKKFRRAGIEVIEICILDDVNPIFEKVLQTNLIVMDACVCSRRPNSMPLIKRLREAGYKNPIIAASESDKCSDLLLEAGASHKAEKREVPKLVLQLLNIPESEDW